MTRIFLFLFSLLSLQGFAADIELPLGGVISVDADTWDVQKTEKVYGSHSLIFIHKTHKDLQGLVFDGTIKDAGLCKQAPVSRAWKVCDRRVKFESKISYQILAQRLIAPKIYQTYIFAFNYASEKDAEYAEIFKVLSREMETKK